MGWLGEEEKVELCGANAEEVNNFWGIRGVWGVDKRGVVVVGCDRVDGRECERRVLVVVVVGVGGNEEGKVVVNFTRGEMVGCEGGGVRVRFCRRVVGVSDGRVVRGKVAKVVVVEDGKE